MRKEAARLAPLRQRGALDRLADAAVSLVFFFFKLNKVTIELARSFYNVTVEHTLYPPPHMTHVSSSSYDTTHTRDCRTYFIGIFIVKWLCIVNILGH